MSRNTGLDKLPLPAGGDVAAARKLLDSLDNKAVRSKIECMKSWLKGPGKDIENRDTILDSRGEERKRYLEASNKQNV